MPKNYEYFGLDFFIYPDDHLPVHLHVKHDNRETVFNLLQDGTTSVRRKRNGTSLKENDRKKVHRFINAKRQDIISKWNQIQTNKSIKCEIVTKRIRNH